MGLQTRYRGIVIIATIKRILWGRKARMPGASWICMVMSGNGVKIGMEITVARRSLIQRTQNQVISVWLVEEVGLIPFTVVVLLCVVDTVPE